MPAARASAAPGLGDADSRDVLALGAAMHVIITLAGLDGTEANLDELIGKDC
jgi:hypothetical protein